MQISTLTRISNDSCANFGEMGVGAGCSGNKARVQGPSANPYLKKRLAPQKEVCQGGEQQTLTMLELGSSCRGFSDVLNVRHGHSDAKESLLQCPLLPPARWCRTARAPMVCAAIAAVQGTRTNGQCYSKKRAQEQHLEGFKPTAKR